MVKKHIKNGGFELIFEKNLPPPIIIDEAIEVARKYSGQEAAVFVNEHSGRNLQEPARKQSRE